TLGAILAAWKSTECAIGALFVSVTRTVWPSRAWITGPGAEPLNDQALYLIPGAIWITSWLMERLTSTTGPAVAAGSSAGNALCAVASASAFAGAAPAKLGVATPATVEVPMPGIPARLGGDGGRGGALVGGLLRLPLGSVGGVAHPDGDDDEHSDRDTEQHGERPDQDVPRLVRIEVVSVRKWL